MDKQRPSILLITTDMQHHRTLGCYGNPVIQTPHVDGLAAHGVRFAHAFANNPVCMPVRATIFTGKLPSAHGVRWNCGGLAAHEVTITRRLFDAGYQTAAIGKMHWGDVQADLGLEYLNVTDGGRDDVESPNITSPGVVGYHEYLLRAKIDGVPSARNLPQYRELFGAVAWPLPVEYHVDSFIGQATREFLAGRDRQRPFFCWCSFNGPHLPIDPAEPWDRLYDAHDVTLPVWQQDELDHKPPEQRAFQRNIRRGNRFGDYRDIVRDPNRLRRFIAFYWGKISMIDHIIGQVVAELEGNGDRENTVIIFTSDHGDFVGHHGMMFKNAFGYDDLLRVPLILSCPRRWQPGVVDGFVETVDLPSSILELAGLEPHQGMQGESFLPLVEGQAKSWRDAAYGEAVDKRVIRTREWKLIHYSGRPYGELYNLIDDPGELRNCYGDPAYTSIQMALQTSMLDRIQEMEDRLHFPVPYQVLDDTGYPGHGQGRVRIPAI